MPANYEKIWNSMNSLEMVTSKVCSAREILDCAIDALQEHQNDKAESLMNAAYEFLEYYLQEFDSKFKVAWQATVKDFSNTDTLIDEINHLKAKLSRLENPDNPNYTDEEIDAMCDDAIKQRNTTLSLDHDDMLAAGFDITSDGFWIPPGQQDKVKKWILPVDHFGDSYFVTFPDDLLKAANLKEGDRVEWIDRNDGSFEMRKVNGTV